VSLCTRRATRGRLTAADCDHDCDCPDCAARTWTLFPGGDLNEHQWSEINALLYARAGNLCEGCGLPFIPGAREPSRHHRRSRHMGGTRDLAIHNLANLLLLCGGKLAGVQGCHGRVESERATAEAAGLLVSWGPYMGDGEPPEVGVPVVVHAFGARPGPRVWLHPLVGSRGARFTLSE